MKKDLFLNIVYVLFGLTLAVNLFLCADIYFELERNSFEREVFGKVFWVLNILLVAGFMAYPIYGNIKYGVERKKIWPLFLIWLAVVVLFVFIAINFIMKGMS